LAIAQSVLPGSEERTWEVPRSVGHRVVVTRYWNGLRCRRARRSARQASARRRHASVQVYILARVVCQRSV